MFETFKTSPWSLYVCKDLYVGGGRCMCVCVRVCVTVSYHYYLISDRQTTKESLITTDSFTHQPCSYR